MRMVVGAETLQIRKADRFFSRFRGLMLKRSMDENSGLLLIPCSSIHMFFMRFPIDAVYLDRHFSVLGKETLSPWQIGGRHKGTYAVLELSAGKAETIRTGDVLSLQP